VSKSQSQTAKLDAAGAGRFRVSGVLDADTAGDLLKASHEPFASAPALEVDLAGVTQADSAGLALLIEWVRIAKEARRTIRFENVPDQIVALARISEVEDLLFSHTAGPASAAATA
jgi:phospholipid transport system transporter-binding protein